MQLPEDYDSPALEPKLVAGWLGLPGSQLPRETAKIIGQPAQPARKKGASARYSVKDAVLMKFGRTLTELGVTPHRVRACVEKVRGDYHTVLTGWASTPADEHTDHEFFSTWYIVGREKTRGFKVSLVHEEAIALLITESGIDQVNWRGSIRDEMTTELLEAPEDKRVPIPKLWIPAPFDQDEASKRIPKGTLDPRELETSAKGGSSPAWRERLAEDYDGQVYPGSPAIVQNMTRYVQDQTRQLQAYVEGIEPTEER